MIDLNDPHWENLQDPYGRAYDPRPVLRKLEAGEDQNQALEELWEELHHQGDIADASYAAIVTLVDMQKRQHNLDWNLYGIAVTIEVERHRQTNPPVPQWLAPAYHQAWIDLLDLALEELRLSQGSLCLRSALAAVVLAKHLTKLGAVIIDLDESELDELLDEWCAWTDLYRNDNFE